MPARQRTKTKVESNSGKESRALDPCRAPVSAVDCSSGCGSCSMGVLSDDRLNHSNRFAGSAVVVFLLPLAGACLGAMLDSETAVGQLLSSAGGFSACVLLSIVISRKVRQFSRDTYD